MNGLIRTSWIYLFIASLILFPVRLLFAQQDPQFSQYFLNPYVFNPAFAGTENALSATAQFRSQWVGIEGHPVIQNLSIHSPVPLLHGGVGIGVLNSEEGAMRNTFVNASYSLILKTKAGEFSFGVNGGIIQSELDGSKLRAPEGDYSSGINHNDNILPNVSVDGMAPDFAAGIVYKGRNLTVGISADHLAATTVKLDKALGLEMNFNRQYYLEAGYMARLSKSITLKPSVMAKSSGDYYQAEGDLVLQYKNFIWFGAGYRGFNNQSMDAAIGTVGIRISENLSVGYSYDYTTSALGGAENGSHEVLLNYRVNLVKTAKPGKVIYTPRF